MLYYYNHRRRRRRRRRRYRIDRDVSIVVGQ